MIAFQASRPRFLEIGEQGALLLLPGILCLSILTLWVLRYFRQLRQDKTEPPLLPYWIPGLGHLFKFLWSYQAFLDEASDYFKSTTPYTIVLGGQKFHILPEPADVTLLYRKSKSTTFDGFVEHLMTRGFNISAATMHFMLNSPAPGPESLLISSHAFYARCLIPGEGEGYNRSTQKISQHLRNLFEISLPLGDDTVVWSQNSRRSEAIALYTWCRTVLVGCISDCLYSPQLRQRAPNITEIFGTFDDGSWKVIYGLPRIFAKDVYDAREKIRDALQAVLAQGTDGMEDIAGVRAKQLRAGGVSEHDVASFTAMIYWAVNGNIYKVAYWMIVSILKLQGLVDTIRAETAAAFDEAHLLHSAEFLLDAEKCPVLDACYKETLRLYSASNSIRTVESDFSIGKYRFRKGSCILAPSQNSHMAVDLWGNDSNSFDHRRFLRDPKASRHPGYRPFGGGASQCPGRYLARYEIFSFVSTLFHRYEVTFETQPLCIPTKEKLMVGAKEPMDVSQVKIVLEERK